MILKKREKMTGKRDPYYTSPQFIGLCFREYERVFCADCLDIKECLKMGREELRTGLKGQLGVYDSFSMYQTGADGKIERVL